MCEELSDMNLENVAAGLNKTQSKCLADCALGCAAKCVVPVTQANRAVAQAARQ